MNWCYQRQARSMKALQRVVWSLIFLAFWVHLANAEEQENQYTGSIAREVHQTLQVDVQWKRMHLRETCEWKSDQKDSCEKRREKRNSQGKDPRTFREPVASSEKSQRKRSGRKRRKLKMKKQVKQRRRSWWKKCKGRIASLVTTRMNEEKKENERRKRERETSREVLGKSGRWLLLLVLLGRIGVVSTLRKE